MFICPICGSHEFHTRSLENRKLIVCKMDDYEEDFYVFLGESLQESGRIIARNEGSPSLFFGSDRYSLPLYDLLLTGEKFGKKNEYYVSIKAENFYDQDHNNHTFKVIVSFYGLDSDNRLAKAIEIYRFIAELLPGIYVIFRKS